MTAPLTADETADYLARVGAAAPEAPTAAALASLHRAHLLAVPFENLDIPLGRPIHLDRDALLDKVVGARRGGYCYELNGLFALLLRSLGYAVDLVSARVATADGGLTDDFDHLALIVTGGGLDVPVLADVGFGDAFIEPLVLRDGERRAEPGKDVGLVRADGDWHYRERRPGSEWRTQYVFDPAPHPLSDFEERNVWQQTSPDSHFTRSRVASRLTPTGRVTLSGERLITTTHGRRHESALPDEDAVLAALVEHFGIVLG
ncbi:arylamine N-acetyltransferase [Terrabacter aerolatus]|uniref:Acetyltransferase n=1 Tax=Terrabacter aerolatus TaxID=422442 RepID=A0A512D5A5_9MICO|nr:arylamine N-acetyltransferase [Terrabacter aerolatus]GEO31655.1 acetyltransferase [Terrabacter aerolatus]